MGKCNVCGKKGLFLRVNVYGRCKQCDERIKKEEHLKLQKEEEERNRRAAERAKERLEAISENNKHALNCVSKIPAFDETFDCLTDCVVTDIETTGLSCYSDSIIEIAAIKIIDGKVVGVYESLIHRSEPLDSEIISLTGITSGMLKNCNKSLDMVISEYNDFIGCLPLVGHNIESFDIEFLQRAYMQVFGRKINNRCIDTLKMSYACFYDASSHKLGSLAIYAGTRMGVSHRALGDCETTLYLYDHMMKRNAAKLIKWSEKGKVIDETDQEYPQYIAKRYPDERCYEYHKKILHSGYLRQANKVESICAFRTSELKEILAEHSLKVSGSKVEIISRVVMNVDIDKIDLPELYIPTEKGTVLVRRLLNEECSNLYKEVDLFCKQQKAKKAMDEERKELIKEKAKRSSSSTHRGKSILQMDDIGNVIKEYDSIAAAAKNFGISSKCIRDAAKGVQKHAGGFCWSYKE